MAQVEIDNKLRKLEETLEHQNHLIQSLLKSNETNNAVDGLLADRTRLLNISKTDQPEFTTVRHSLHNGVRHQFYCTCLVCREFFFCFHPPARNKAGCLTHYGLVHPQMKAFWKPGY